MQEPVVWISADSHALVDYSKSPELADFMSPLIGVSVALPRLSTQRSVAPLCYSLRVLVEQPRRFLSASEYVDRHPSP